MRPARGARVLLGAAVGALVLAGCGGGSGDGAGSTTTTAPKLPAACQGPPATFDLQGGGDRPAGGASFSVTDAVARRVAVLPGEMAFDPAALSGLEKKAAVTPLAAYTLYLGDFDLDTEAIGGVGATPIAPAEGQTLGAVTVVPPTETPLATGDAVAAGKPDYATNQSLATLSAAVVADGAPPKPAAGEVAGTVELLHVGDDALCAAVDVTVSDGGEVVAKVKGTISAPVVRAADAYFLN